jgi:IclR family transcriptional regulator, acetate operon repressor
MNVAVSTSPADRPVIANRRSGSSTKHDRAKGCTPAASARGVLDGAFAVLEALSRADNGLGLSALARASGIAKSSAYRLAEQLVELGAAQCIEHRYYIGPTMERIGRRWQPDPLVRQSAQAPVHNLAVQCRGMAALRILHEHQLRIVCATTPHGHAHMPNPADSESIARTATGRVLYAAQPASDVTLPDCWTRREWRKLRVSIRKPGATVVDHEDAVAGICCVSAPVWGPGGACAGAVTAMVFPAQLRPNLLDLVSRTSHHISAGLLRPMPT